MKRSTSKRFFGASLLIALLALTGCQKQSEPSRAATAPTPEPSQLGDAAKTKAAPADLKRKATAAKAKDELFTQLSGRLMQVMQSEGPVAAIAVCSQEAATIANAVGQQHAVEIGRTSFKLRNPANRPRDWVQPFVDSRTDTVQHVALDDGKLGALFPIKLQVNCLMCHGGPEDILDAVKPELAKRYPDDAATGFQQGELRGWFWVEVP
jgi:hypothetical protein